MSEHPQSPQLEPVPVDLRKHGYARLGSELAGAEVTDVPAAFLTGRPRRKSPGNCYQKAFQYAMDKGQDIPELRVIHGHIEVGTVADHAWVELPGGIVFD